MGKNIKYTHRYLARIIIEATIPLAMGTGEGNVMTDRLIATDVNGLPSIPGTALAGVLRNALTTNENGEEMNELFGFQNGDKGLGSRLILSSAQMLGPDGKIIDGIQSIPYNTEFYANFLNLPIRQHVRISHKGASEGGGKFDEQVVYKGTRFCFEMELVGTADDSSVWKEMLAQFSNPGFRLCGGTRKGFGEITIPEYRAKEMDLTKELQAYLNKTSDLNDHFWESVTPVKPEPSESGWIKYKITLTPDDFFLFGSGFGTDDADMSYVTETIIEWNDGTGKFSGEKVLIPASSVKGALAHRVAFHYNKTNDVFIDKQPTLDTLKERGYNIDIKTKKEEDRFQTIVTEGNPAVRALFGYSANNNDGQRGNTIFSDLHLEKAANKKLLNHVAIDRFTGGAMDGALFSEEVVGSKETFTLICLANNSVEQEYLDTFESTLKDLCAGMLPLGGGTMRGNGCFTGTITKNGEEFKNEK